MNGEAAVDRGRAIDVLAENCPVPVALYWPGRLVVTTKLAWRLQVVRVDTGRGYGAIVSLEATHVSVGDQVLHIYADTDEDRDTFVRVLRYMNGQARLESRRAMNGGA